ncbi:MAG TPA: ParB/RepB/Spo0J family partition protein [Planctomycetota bacterium]|nr:ParB/RepB/Spo0J family partition protein [Planctomycetota bacterium]
MLIAREAAPSRTEVLDLDPTAIKPNPEQPRKRFAANELEMLKASISKEGILQPILVRKVGESYQVVAGERRLRAAQELGLSRIPALLAAVPDDRLLEVALIENIQRENLNAIDLASAYRQLMEVKRWTQDALAQALGLSRPLVSNTLRLLELPEDMQNSIVRGHITMGHAKVLLSVSDPKEQRLLFEKIAEEKLSVRDLETAREASSEQSAAAPAAPAPTAAPVPGADRKRKPAPRNKTPLIVSLEESLAERLATKVRIREKEGRGRISIDFYSAEDFERIRDVILAPHKGR